MEAEYFAVIKVGYAFGVYSGETRQSVNLFAVKIGAYQDSIGSIGLRQLRDQVNTNSLLNPVRNI